MVEFRVRENTRPIHNPDGSVYMQDYWVYCSDYFTSYYDALKYAIDYDRRYRIGCWVELINTNPDYQW